MVRGHRRPGVPVDPLRVRKARREAGLSLAQVAGDDVSRTFILFIEQGKARPSREVLRLIARRTGKPVEYFAVPSAPAGAACREIPNELLAIARRLRRLSGTAGLAAGEREGLRILELALKQAARFVRSLQPHADKGAAILIASLSLAV